MPRATVEAGEATLRFGITDRTGVSALDTGRPMVGPGADHLAEALNEVLSGTTQHGGALFAPFAVRYVVADADSLPPAAAERLTSQLDLNLVPAAGLVIFRNTSTMPPAAILDADKETAALIHSGTPGGRRAAGRRRRLVARSDRRRVVREARDAARSTSRPSSKGRGNSTARTSSPAAPSGGPPPSNPSRRRSR